MQDVRLVFLGTSSAAPSRERNVSSIAIALDGRVVLFDCGEGTQQQLLRAPVRSGAIEAIFITHLHGDHVYGLPGLLATLSLNGREEPLVVCGPRGLRAYVEAVLTTSHHNPIFPVVVREEEAYDGDGFRVTFAPLEHSIPSLGWCVIEDDAPGKFDVARARALGVPEGPLYGRLQLGSDILMEGRTICSADVVGPSRKGRRIAYCTDTRPCASSVALANGADVLIHEATYGVDMAAEAHERFHSTSVDAANIASEANVAALYLTHFSTRYTDVTPLLEEARAVFPATHAAEDFLVVSVARP